MKQKVMELETQVINILMKWNCSKQT
jgi:hypothetical protein